MQPDKHDTTAHQKELQRWERPKREGGENANGYEPYPAMLYKVTRDEAGQRQIEHCTVGSLAESERMQREGWVPGGPDKALAKFNALQDDIAQAAAETAHGAQRMGKKARAEFDQAEAKTDGHVVR
jgi:hypothetical protein